MHPQANKTIISYDDFKNLLIKVLYLYPDVNFESAFDSPYMKLRYRDLINSYTAQTGRIMNSLPIQRALKFYQNHL